MSVIFGSAGFAKEVDWVLHEIFLLNGNSEILNSCFVGKDHNGEQINNVPVLSEDEYLKSLSGPDEIKAYIAVGSPNIRRKIVENLNGYKQFTFPKLIYPNTQFDKREGKVIIGAGTIICGGVIITTDIVIGSHVHVNINTTIGHDTTIGDFCTLSPGVHISGNVKLGNEVFVGTGAVILERLSISDNVVIGAGSVVTKSITEPGVYVGVPAQKLKK